MLVTHLCYYPHTLLFRPHTFRLSLLLASSLMFPPLSSTSFPLKSPPWCLNNFLASAAIPNGTQVSQDSKLTFENKKKHVKFVFLGLFLLVFSFLVPCLW